MSAIRSMSAVRCARGKTAQRGVTMLSLMIGLAISLIATVGLLSVYQGAVHTTVNAQQRTTTDSQLAGVLMRAAASAEDAGYGIASPTYATHLIAINGAALSAGKLSGTAVTAASLPATAANAVVWATVNSASVTQCSGFYMSAAVGLEYLNPTTCTDATAWSTLSWVATPVTGTGLLTSPVSVSFTIAQTSCAPYGITNTQGNYLLTLTSTNSLGNAVTSQQCLLNFH